MSEIKKLFVGSLKWEVEDDELQEAFEEYGEVESAHVVKDRDSGKSKGFGFVEFANAKDAAKALEGMRGAELRGREIHVEYAQPKDDKKPRRSRPSKDADA